MSDIYKSYYDYFIKSEYPNLPRNTPVVPYDLAVSMVSKSDTTFLNKAYKAGLMIRPVYTLIRCMETAAEIDQILKKYDYPANVVCTVCCRNFSFDGEELNHFYRDAIKFVCGCDVDLSIDADDPKYYKLNGILLRGVKCLCIKDNGELYRISADADVNGSSAMNQFKIAIQHYKPKSLSLQKCVGSISCNYYTETRDKRDTHVKLYKLVDDYAVYLSKYYCFRK